MIIPAEPHCSTPSHSMTRETQLAPNASQLWCFFGDEKRVKAEKAHGDFTDACMRSAWMELARSHHVPQVWGELDASGRKFFHSFVEDAYPLFKCTHGGWKLDKLAHMNYPAWKAEHLDKTGNLLSKEDRKRKRGKCKTEEDESENSISVKKQRLDVLSENDTAMSGSDGASSTTSYSAPSLSSTSGSQTSASHTSPAPADKSAVSSNEGSESGQDQLVQVTTTPSPAPTPELQTSGSPSHTSESPLSDGDLLRVLGNKDRGLQPKTIPTSNEANSNPLPLQPVTSIPNPHKSSSTQSAPSSSDRPKKAAKMRPGPARNGRNLCAWRWLKAFKETSTGSTAEFKEYYEALSSQQKEAYDKEAKELVSSNAWTTAKDVENGNLH
ncbi:hypothetical protein V8E55_008660 [Tylopilus felleus]